MRQIKTFFVYMICVVLGCLFLELTIPSARGLTIGLLGLFGIVIDNLYFEDIVYYVFFSLLLAFGLYGTVRGLSKKQESKVQMIVSLVTTILSAFSLIRGILT